MASYSADDLSEKNKNRPETFYDFDVTAALERPRLCSSSEKSAVYGRSRSAKVFAAIILFFILAGFYSLYWQWPAWYASYQESPILYIFLAVIGGPFYLLLFLASTLILVNKESIVLDKSRGQFRIYRGFSPRASFMFNVNEIQVLCLKDVYREHDDGDFDIYDAIFAELKDGSLVSLFLFPQHEGQEVFQSLCKDLDALITRPISAESLMMADPEPES